MSKPELFIAEEEIKSLEFVIKCLIPTSEFGVERSLENDNETKAKENLQIMVVKPVATKFEKKEGEDEEEEGFQTPKSRDHRIPEILTCPPAPKKRRPPKRKSCISENRFFKVSSGDLESIFAGINMNSCLKIKRARAE
ncbi:hypothetical protein AMTRI_Chr08g204680 [Amborella trichopoda]